MAELRDVAAYLCRYYPHKHELSNARLTKMVYLADWKSAVERGCQLTNIRWVFDQYGPYVPDVLRTAADDEAFEITVSRTVNGDPKRVIAVREDADYASLDHEDRAILDFVIASTAPKYWADFIRLVYSTYPIVTQPRGSHLDLAALAHEYKDQQDLLISDPPVHAGR